MLTEQDLLITSLGEPHLPSPVKYAQAADFVREEQRIRLNVETSCEEDQHLSFEQAGPRAKVYFDPIGTTAAIMTCGGLSPGLNNVIRSAYYELSENYGVKRILGIRNGYAGLNPALGLTPIELTRDFVEPIDKLGGTVLGSSRGSQNIGVMSDFLQSQQVNLLFCIGGDGTQRGAQVLKTELESRGNPIAVVGIPKTIDNDVAFVRRSFGFTTALEKAAEVIRGAHVEARDAPNGIGVVKLMGRHAGFIAAGASIVSQEVNFTLIPEVEFPLKGEGGFLDSLEARMKKRGHAVIVVAEGAGQHLFKEQQEQRDASGNLQHHDIGVYLNQVIKEHFAQQDISIALKYIDPSYLIRSVPANAYDRYLSDQMARHAVHAGMAGKTGLMIGYEHDRFIHVPINTVVSKTKTLDTTGEMWRAVLQVTRQPRW